MIARILISLIKLYKRLISPLFPNTCRFYPTCSTYTKEALKHHGAVKGLALGFKRIAKCNPFHPGGVDHVPDTEPNYLLSKKEWK